MINLTYLHIGQCMHDVMYLRTITHVRAYPPGTDSLEIDIFLVN